MGLKIQWTNFSNHTWTLWDNQYNGTFNETESNAPSEKLLSKSGGSTMAAAQDANLLKNFGTDVYSIACGYKSEDSAMYLGVACQQEAQVFGIGSSPTWSYLFEGKWVGCGSSAEVKTFDVGDVSVRITPTVTHDDVSVEVNIQNKH